MLVLILIFLYLKLLKVYLEYFSNLFVYCKKFYISKKNLLPKKKKSKTPRLAIVKFSELLMKVI